MSAEVCGDSGVRALAAAVDVGGGGGGAGGMSLLVMLAARLGLLGTIPDLTWLPRLAYTVSRALRVVAAAVAAADVTLASPTAASPAFEDASKAPSSDWLRGGGAGFALPATKIKLLKRSTDIWKMNNVSYENTTATLIK